jgi:hypothetical protein
MVMVTHLSDKITLGRSLGKVQEELIAEYNPLAIGIFGSGSKEITYDSDVDLYVLKNHLPRLVKREPNLIFEIYFESPKNISKAILSKDARIIDRFRNSRALYDPKGIYFNLRYLAKKQMLREELWKEDTIIGADYDLVERTSINVSKALQENNLESSIISIQYLMERIVELGFRRLNISEYANPKKIPDLITRLPKKTAQLYKQIKFSDVRNPTLIKGIMEEIERNKLDLLPLIT